MKKVKLSNEEKRYYARQIILPEISFRGQEKLKRTSVLVVGLGGLGSAVSLYLTSGGIGKLGLIDMDDVEIVNLHRQILFNVNDIGKNKAKVAKEKLSLLNPYCELISYAEQFTESNAEKLVSEYDYIADCTDNFETRYLINEASVRCGKPFIYAAIYKFEGQVSVFNYRNGPCYKCLYPNTPDAEAFRSCDNLGVISTTPGIIGCIQANEIIKLAANIGSKLSGKLLCVNFTDLSFRIFNVKKNANCAVCS